MASPPADMLELGLVCSWVKVKCSISLLLCINLQLSVGRLMQSSGGSVVLQTQFYNNLYDSSSQTLLYWMAARLVLTNCLALSNLLCFDWLVCQSDMLETDRVYITMCLPLHSPPTFVSIWMSIKCVTSVELIWSDTRTLATISSDSMQSGWLVQSFMIGYCVV